MPATAPTPATQGHRLYLARSRFGALDGLRALCILAVLWHHGPLREALAGPRPLIERGFLGVDFFFVLSGFLITTLLLREERARGRFSLAGFYWRRLLRIVPVYFCVVTVVALWFVVMRGREDLAAILPYYYLFLSNFLTTEIPLLAPTWSLAVEEQYYLVWPLLLLLLPRRMVLPVVGGLIVLNVLGIMGLLAPLGIVGFDLGPHLHVALPHATYAPILLGSALAMILQDGRGFALVQGVLGGRAAAPLLLGGLVLLAQILPQDLRGLPNLVLHLTMTATLAALVLREDSAITPILSWAPLARIGEISYGIYLYHLIALHFGTALAARAGITSPWLVLVAYSLLSILIAEISFRTLEAVFRGLRGRVGQPTLHSVR